MSEVLYYSNHCIHCKNLLQYLSKTQYRDDIHFLCIDTRVKRKDGTIYIQLQNGSEVLLPPLVKQVPSLLLLNRENMIFVGNQINDYYKTKEQNTNKRASNYQAEPEAFGMNMFGSFHNDVYSFIDHDPDDMLAKGNGGMRQTFNYASLDHVESIETPPENYVPNKIKDVSLDELKRSRENDIPREHKRV